VEFAEGEYQKTVKINIHDDDCYEPNKNFYVQLFDGDDTTKMLEGTDTRTRITIIDDDKPGVFFFDEVDSDNDSEGHVHVAFGRREGYDGTVTVEYNTKDVDDTNHTATAGVDYEA